MATERKNTRSRTVNLPKDLIYEIAETAREEQRSFSGQLVYYVRKAKEAEEGRNGNANSGSSS